MVTEEANGCGEEEIFDTFDVTGLSLEDALSHFLFVPYYERVEFVQANNPELGTLLDLQHVYAHEQLASADEDDEQHMYHGDCEYGEGLLNMACYLYATKGDR